MGTYACKALAEGRALASADDGYVNVSKTPILPKGITQEAAFAAALSIITSSPCLAGLIGNVALASFVPEGFVGIGVPIATCPLPRYPSPLAHC